MLAPNRTSAIKFFILLSMANCSLPAAGGEIPDQLPDPDGKPADMSKPVKVYILMGQSNMLEMGKVAGDKDGTLEHAVKSESLYPYLVDDAGNWTVRQDVRNVAVMGSGGPGKTQVRKNDWLKVAGGKIGVEIGIGHHMGELHDGPVLILKSAIGNRSLGWDLLPPGSPSYEFTDPKDGKTYVYAGYGQSPLRWEKGTGPEPIAWKAGLQYDGDIARAKEVLNDLGSYYPGARKPETEPARVSELKTKIAEMEDFARRARFTEEGLRKHNSELAALRSDVSKLKAESRGYEVAGFFFWQGDKDRYNAGHAQKYEQNLVNLIKQLRNEFDAPNAKFVCATLGQTDKDNAKGTEKDIIEAQLAVDGKSGKYPDFKSNVATVYTHPLSKGGASNSHYGGNAETYMNVGEAMGRAMVELLQEDSQ